MTLSIPDYQPHHRFHLIHIHCFITTAAAVEVVEKWQKRMQEYQKTEVNIVLISIRKLPKGRGVLFFPLGESSIDRSTTNFNFNYRGVYQLIH